MAKAIGEGPGRQEGAAERENSGREEEREAGGSGSLPCTEEKGKGAGHRQRLAPLRAVGGRSGIAELNSHRVGVSRVVAPTCLVPEILTKHWDSCHIPQSVLGRELTDVLRTNPNIFSKLRATL